MKTAIEANCFEHRIGGATGFDHRHRYGDVAGLPLQLHAEYEAVFVAQDRGGHAQFERRFRFAFDDQPMCGSNTEYSLSAVGIVSSLRNRRLT